LDLKAECVEGLQGDCMQAPAYWILISNMAISVGTTCD